MFWKLCRRPLSTGTGHCFLVHFFKRNTLVPIIQFQKEHGGAAFIAPEGVIAESMEDGRTPFIKAAQDMMFFTGNCPKQFFVDISVPGINTAITYHFEMFFRDMPDQTLDEFKGRNRFCHILIIFMPVVMESDVSTGRPRYLPRYLVTIFGSHVWDLA